MYFKDIPGKKKEKEYLLSNVKDDRLAHAQLFLGRTGSGQLPLALAFASFLLCKDRISEDSCGKCSACLKSHKFIHPDIHFAFPVVKKDGKNRNETTSNDFLIEWRSILRVNPFLDIKAWLHSLNLENGQANINVKECVEIVKKLGLKTFEADYKILIMWMPEYLRNEGNRLLKLIEEPPENTIILLVAEKQDDILNTILSRVQLLKVNPFSDLEIKQYLNEKHSIPLENSDQIVGIASGNMNTAIQLASQESVNYSDSLFQWLRIAYKMEPVELGKWVNEMSTWGRENQKNFLDYGLHFFREYLFSLITGKKNLRLNEYELSIAQKMTSLLDISKTEQLISIFNDCIGSIERNANPKILFLADSLSIGRVMRNQGVGKEIYTV
jgi:DNA polymerase-3 subunit delta'